MAAEGGAQMSRKRKEPPPAQAQALIDALVAKGATRKKADLSVARLCLIHFNISILFGVDRHLAASDALRVCEEIAGLVSSGAIDVLFSDDGEPVVNPMQYEEYVSAVRQ